MPRRPAKVTQADIARAIRAQGSRRERSLSRWRGRYSDCVNGKCRADQADKQFRRNMGAVASVAALPETHRKRVKRNLCD
jgi:hypothetical protein